LAGYPGLIPDNSYAPNMDAAINAGTMATLLPQDLGISTLSAASIGFALTSLQGTYPMDENFSHIMLYPITTVGDVAAADFVKRAVVANFAIRKGTAADGDLADDLQRANINDVSCTAYGNIMDKANFTHECNIPNIPWPAMVRVAGVYSGEHFEQVMPEVPKGKYAVLFIRTGQLVAKEGTQNVFSYKKGVLSNSIAILPFISANSQGKHLVYLNGKATLI